jgi:hypothetical protein
MTAEGTTDVGEALAEVCAVLDSDGFTGEWQESDDGVVFRVGVGTADCEDCLVPRPVLELMVGSALVPTGRRLARLEMPEPGAYADGPAVG